MNNLEFFNRNEARDFINKNKPMAIIPTGSVEQHLNHLFIGMDINSATKIAEELANKFSKDTIFYRPLNVGIAEHHMAFPGTMTLRVNTFIGVLTDVVNSMIRGGITKILFINGHGGNTEPMRTAMQNINLEMKGVHSNIDTSEVRSHIDYMELLNKDSEIDIKYTSYWEMHDPNFIKEVIKDPNYPGHAGEYETSLGLYLFPDFIDKDLMKNKPLGTANHATKEKGKLIYEDLIEKYSKLLQEMFN